MITTVELEIQQDQDTGAQLSVVAPPIPAAELAALLSWFRGARMLELVIRATSPREPTVRISYTSFPPEPAQPDDSFQTFAFDKDLNGGDRSALQTFSRNGTLGLQGSEAKIAQHARALRPARQDAGRIVFPAQPDEGFFVDADKGDFHRAALRAAAAGPPAKLPVRVITEGSAEYRQIFETHTPGFSTFPGRGISEKTYAYSKNKPDGIDRIFKPKFQAPPTARQRIEAVASAGAMVKAGADRKTEAIVLEIKYGNMSRGDAAEYLGITADALDKRIQRREMEEAAMRDGKSIPNVPCKQEQSDDIWNNGATYVLVDLNGWRWHKLNVQNGHIEAAVDTLKLEKFSEALRQRPEYKAGRKGQAGDHPEWMAAFKEVKQQYDAAFDVGNYRVFTAPKKPWFGLIGDEIVGLSAVPALMRGDDSEA